MRKKLVVLLFYCIYSFTANAQGKTITGKVTDENSLPLMGVSVTIKGTDKGTVTDKDGTFSLVVSEKIKSLTFSFINYATQEVNIGTKTNVSVIMLTEAKSLSDVVVVGYGTQKKKELTGSVAQVKGADLANRPIQGPDQALRGQVAGVTVTQSSGTPGSSMNVNIRGTGSINASSQPLYVVDGVPINTGSYSQIGVGGQTLNSLADINPNEVESYEILKDAAATAIYGSRAANGVVLITTKRGANTKTKINISSYYGTSNIVSQIPVLTGPQYVQLVQESFVNRFGSGTLPSAFQFVGLDNNPSTYPTTNWQDQIFAQGQVQSHDISLQGGNDKSKFFVSGSYFDQKGIVLNSDFKRYNFRLNLDNKVTDKFKVSTGIGLSRSISNRISNDNNIYGVVSTSILLGSHIPAYNSNGSYGRDPNSSVENPLANAYEVTNIVANNRILANFSGEYEIVKNLTFKTLFGIDFIGLREQNFVPSTHLQAVGVKGDGTEGYTQDFNWINENILTYKKSIGNHSFAFTGVASYQESIFESVFARAQNFPGNRITRLSAGSVRVSASSTGSSWGLIGYIGRLNYSYKNKYLASASLRRDGVSRFGENKRWGTFPAVSGAWRISEESFMSKIKFISDLKIRGSYGKSGNSSVADFASRSLIGGGVNYLQTAGLAPAQLGNQNLGWEESEQTDIGLELQLFKKINITAEYYTKNTNNLLLARLLPGSSGFLTVIENIGKLQNKGFELSVNGDIISNDDFRWNANFNITFPQNKVLKLAGSPIAQGFASWVEEGQDLGSFRGYVVKGIFQSQAEINAAPIHSSATRPGDIQFEDIDKDGRITANDQRILGSAVPDYFGGFTNTLSYKGFSLNVFVQYTQGNYIYNNTRSFAEAMNSVFGQAATTLNRWTPTNTNTNIPRAVFGDPNNNRRTSNRWLEDGSFVRIKNLLLAYDVPAVTLKKLKLNSLRFFVQGENLHTWTKYSGLDPEVSTFSVTNTAPGTDFLTYPQARTFTFGLNIGF